MRPSDGQSALYVAADLELRRRHPDMRIEALRPHPAEAAGIVRSEPAGRPGGWAQLTVDGTQPAPPEGHGTEPVPGRNRAADTRLALGLTPQAVRAEIPGQVKRICENATIARARLDEIAGMPAATATADGLSLSPGWLAPAGRRHGALLQPPQPEIIPAAGVVERYAAGAAGRSAEPERG